MVLLGLKCENLLSEQANGKNEEEITLFIKQYLSGNLG